MRKKLLTHFLALAFAMTAGCGSRDADGDGFSREEGDCNDDVAAINPNGSVKAESVEWVTPEYECPRGATRLAEPDDGLQIRISNNGCSVVTISDARVQMTVREAYGTYNQVGQTWSGEHVPFSPPTIPGGGPSDVIVDGHIVCTNPSGGDAYNVYEAEVTLQTSAGVLQASTIGGHRTRFSGADDAAAAARVDAEAVSAVAGGGVAFR